MLAAAAAITVLVAVMLWRAIRAPATEVRERRWIMGWGVGFSLAVLALAIRRWTFRWPGTYDGLCAEFCGLEHSAMRFAVVAYDPEAPLPDFASAPVLVQEPQP